LPFDVQENQGMAMENGTIIDGLPMKIVIFHSYVTYHNARPAFFVRTYRSAKRRDDVQALSRWLELFAPQQGSADS